MNYLPKMSLKRKILIFFVFLAILPLIISNLIWVFSTRSQILQTTFNQINTSAQDMSNRVESYIEIKEIGLIIHSQTESLLNKDISTSTKELHNFLLQDQDMQEISLLDSNGMELAKLSRNKIFTKSELTDQSNTAAFKVPTFVGSQEYISPIEYQNQEPIIQIAVPIVVPDNAQDLSKLSTGSVGRGRKPGEVLGVLVAQYKLTNLWNEIGKTQISKNGYAFIVDDKNIIIEHPNNTFVSTKKPLNEVLSSTFPLFNNAHAYYNGRNEEKINALITYANVNLTGWKVITEVPVSDTLTQVNQIIVFTIVLLIVLISSLLLLSVSIANRIIDPIEQLREGSHLIGSGNLNYKIDIHTGDEIEDLGNSFNIMSTNLKKAFEEQEEAKNIISAERNKISITLSSIGDGVIAIDLQRKIIIFNRAVEKMTGILENQAIGQPITSLFKILDNKTEISPETYAPIQKGNYEGIVFQQKNVKLSPVQKVNTSNAESNGTYVNITTSHIAEGLSVNLGCIITLHDVNQEQQLEEMKLDFVSMAAHELRTPLTSLRGYTYIILRDYASQLDEFAKTAINRIDISAQRLTGLVENLLNVTRVERGKFTVHLEPIDWIASVDEVFEEIKDQAKDKHITLTFDKPQSSFPKVNADKLRIAEVVTNLIANAISYTQSGGSIRVWIEQTPTEIITHVTDNGEGIPPQALPHLFTKFFRVSGRLEQGSKGTGLGLYISKYIVETHKGRIWVESEGLGKGSTFSFSLPIANSTITTEDKNS